MFEWPNQIADYQRAWFDQQQAVLTNWIGTLNGSKRSDTALNLWQQAVNIMDQQVNSALDSQKQTLISLTSNPEESDGVPEPVSQWLHQIQQGVELWSEVQHHLWQVWFDMLRTAVPPAEQTPAESLLGAWQELARRNMAIQEEWLTNWTGGPTGNSGKSAADEPVKPARTTSSSTSKRSNKARSGG